MSYMTLGQAGIPDSKHQQFQYTVYRIKQLQCLLKTLFSQIEQVKYFFRMFLLHSETLVPYLLYAGKAY